MAAAVPYIIGGATVAQVMNQYQQGASASAAASINARRIREAAEYNAGLLKAQSEITAATAMASARYDAAVAKNTGIVYENAAIASMQDAKRARHESQYEADRIRDRNKRLRGAQVVRVAKSGIMLEGSPSDVIYDSAVQGELDALAAEYIGDVEERQFLIESVNRRYSAKMARHQGYVRLIEGKNNANIALWEADTKSKLLKREAYLQSSGLLEQGRSAMRQSYWNMAGTLLTNALLIGYGSPGFFTGGAGAGIGTAAKYSAGESWSKAAFRGVV